MRNKILLTAAFLLVVPEFLPAQERVPLPPPDPTGPGYGAVPSDRIVPPPPPQPLQVGGQSPVAADQSPFQVPPPAPNPQPPYPPNPNQPYPQPGPYGPYGPQPYGPPPGPYGPPVRVISFEPGNPNFWIGVDGLVWWTKGQPLSVPLITTGPGSEGANAGALGAPGTTSLNSPLNYGAEGGIRFFAGGWFNSAHTIGLDGSIFFLGQASSSFGAFDRSGAGNTVINEPVVGAPFITQVSAPGVESGGVNVNVTSRFGGGDINGLFNIYRCNGLTVNLLGGFRYLELDETLTIAANSNLFTTTIFTDGLGNTLLTAPPGSSIQVIDQFGTKNQFYGGQIGGQVQYDVDRWFVSATGKLGIGSTTESVNINGTTFVQPVNGSPTVLAGGNYATLQSGHYSQNKFAVAPELGLNFGYQFTPFIRGMVGYNFIYLSSVLRPGNQIDNNYDGVIHPTVPMATSSFWAQGITFSLQFNY
jgi:Putative beta barrel porin-7 (BBP7)